MSGVPAGYRGLLVADTRRAEQWEAGLRAAGIDVVRVEARGADADKGDWQIAVAARDQVAARALVAAVMRGEAKLPRAALLSGTGLRALVAIGVIIVLLAAVLLAGPR